MLGRIALLDVVQLLLLVNVNQHLAIDGFPQAGALDLARLEDHVAVGEDHARAQLLAVRDGVERTRIEPVGEWVIEQERGHFEDVRIARILDAVALEGAEIIRVAEFLAELLEQHPVALLPLSAKGPSQVFAQVGGDTVVVEQGVVDVEQKNYLAARCHGEASSASLDGFSRGYGPSAPCARQSSLRWSFCRSRARRWRRSSSRRRGCSRSRNPWSLVFWRPLLAVSRSRADHSGSVRP